jgi:hypothetical protein
MVQWILRISSRGDDLDRTNISQNGSGSRYYVIGVGHLAWMVSFEWSFICTCNPIALCPVLRGADLS